ncbi:MAG: LysM peptidoglycan-binding domain-containing protein [Burkholderiales bacterium]|nr:LysM peptidoglycan-binding domain-containing protein [Burkholderiales bacterium]
MRKLIIIGAMLLLSPMSGAWAAASGPALDPNAPDRYIVVPGDTLWGISGRFLKDPWRWPQLFELNKDQIKNPHRIFPGDVIVLDRAAGRARVMAGIPTVVLTPKVRVEARAAEAIPSIPPDAIQPFLTQPLVIDQSSLDAAPRIVATQENRMVLGAGSRAFARGINGSSNQFWQVFRPGEPLVDPDTHEQLGFEAVYLGDARVVRPGEVAILEIVRSNQEMYIGDRMFPAPKPSFASYIPRAPEKPITGRIISAYGGLAEAGVHSVVTLNRGSRDGVEVGTVLAVYRSAESAGNIRQSTGPISGFRNTPLWGRQGPTGRDDTIRAPQPETDLPPVRHGLLFVFRTFERVSYALVMQANSTINVLDRVQNP